MPSHIIIVVVVFKKSGGRQQFMSQVDMCPMENCALSPDEEEAKERLWEIADAQMLLRSLARLLKGHHLVSPGDIIDDLYEVESVLMTKSQLSKLLRQFCDRSLIFKNDDGLFSVPLLDKLISFINPDMGYVPDEDDDYDESNSGSSLGLSEEISHIESMDSPIIIDLCDEESSVGLTSISSVSMSVGGSNKRKLLGGVNQRKYRSGRKSSRKSIITDRLSYGKSGG
jgi:hypothetical protein